MKKSPQNHEEQLFYLRNHLRNKLAINQKIKSITFTKKFNGYTTLIKLKSGYTLQCDNHRFSRSSNQTPFEVTILDHKTNQPVYNTIAHTNHKSDDTIPYQNNSGIERLINTLSVTPSKCRVTQQTQQIQTQTTI
jgi:hypothetical protein